MDFADLAHLTTADPERPPPAPVPVDWPAVQEWLGLPLPADYKRLAEAWGTARFGGRYTVRTPYAQDEDGEDQDRFDYGDWLRETHREARIEARALAEPERPAVHPAPGGLLAWGTDQSDTLFWDTSASPDPDRWTVVVLRSRRCRCDCAADRWEAHDLTLTEYLTEACTRPLEPLPATLQRLWDAEHPLPWTPPPYTAPRLTGERRDFALDSGTASTRSRTPRPTGVPGAVGGRGTPSRSGRNQAPC